MECLFKYSVNFEVDMNKTILVVDDEINIRKFITKSFEKIGIEVFTADSAEGALTILKKERIHVMGDR